MQAKLKGAYTMAKGLDGKQLPKGISQRANGLYMGRVMFHGQTYSLYNRSLTELKKEMLDLRYQLEHGIYAKETNLTFDSWFMEWIETYKMRSVKQGTVDSYLKHYHAYIKEPLGKLRLADIRSEHLQKMLNNMAQDGYSDSTIQLVTCILSGVFKQAYKNELIQKNPFSHITKPKGAQAKERIAFTSEQQEIFMRYAEQSYLCNLFQLAICTGMRNGELGGLQWCDIDFKNRVIHIRHNLVSRLGSGLAVDTPKTRTSRRDIPMIDKAYEILKRQEKAYNVLHGDSSIVKLQNTDFVFSVEDNQPISRKRITHEIEVMLERIHGDGLCFPYFTLHTTRHTFATRCAEQGMSLQILKTILGHSSLAMTADLYSHVLPDAKRDAMESVKSAF